MARKLEIEIVSDYDSRGMRQAQKDTDGFGKKLGGLGKAAGFAAGGAALGGLFLTVKAGIGDFTEGAKASAQTAAVLKSTGRAAGVTQGHIEKLAGAIQNKSGLDDAAVQSGENLLLTFTNIRNEAGAGNKIFDQTTAIMADMSTALGQDASSSAIQLGKALNDPIKGVTALQRVGVSFTQAQRDQIKAMVDSGNTIGAQKLILRELNKEFGGSAEAAGKTLPGQLAILKGAFENWSGSMVAKAIPALTGFVGYAREHFGDVQAAVQPFFDWMSSTGLPLIDEFKTRMINGVSAILKAVRADSPETKRLFNDLGAVMRAIAFVVVPLLKAGFFVIETSLKITAREIRAVLTVLGLLDKAFHSAYNAGRDAVNSAGATINAAIDKMADLFERVREALIWIRDKGSGVFKTFWDTVQKPVHAINDAFRAMRDAIARIVDAFRWLLDNAKAIGKVFGALGGAVSGTVGKLNPFGDAADASVGQAKAGISASKSGGAAGRQFNVGSQLWDEIGMGQALGLHVSSGYRPGARTKHGTPSDHGANPSRAVDMAGPAAGMAGLFRRLIGRGEIRQAFYDPLGSIFNGVLSSYREGGHSDHIHIAEYDSGGMLPPGLTLALNRTGRPERIIGPGAGDPSSSRPVLAQLVLPDGRLVAEWLIDPMRSQAKIVAQRTGKPAFS